MAGSGSTPHRVTLADVAARAGVSLATVSKVMSGRYPVRHATQVAVAEAAHEVGYVKRRRRNESGRRVVALHLESMDSTYVMGVLEGAESAARRAGADLLVRKAGGRGLEREWMAVVAERGAEGVVAVVPRLEARHARWSRSLSLPLLAIDPVFEGPGPTGVVTITATNWEGGASAVRHLLELGHRRIGVLAGPRTSVPGRQRLEGYLSALSRAGISVDEELVRYGEFGHEDGEDGAGRLLDLADPPTAIFAASDPLAAGTIRAARHRGVAVPEDLSVIGFDDTMITRWTSPRLTAVRQPLFEMGQVAVERLLALSSDPGLFAHPFKLETQLIERESTAPARSTPRGR